ncbi:hypothetical protein [Roseateles chitosanitabidus]|uniref:hypothetical protein n=1 Tax=Roseateles chitosanitabidus TaxID=65048 RepID=UPI0011E06700|nr:hypothetical protein [Roseateles chitosanitabidus]
MPKFRLEPTCRYGHGAMKRENGYYAYSSVKLSGPVNDEKTMAFDGGGFFLVALFKCETCGYAETIDPAFSED